MSTAATEKEPSKVDSLLQWLRKSDQCYINPKIEVFEDRTCGRGIRLSDGTLKKNETVITIPGSHQLNHSTVSHWVRSFENSRVTDEQNDMTDPRYKAYGTLDTKLIDKLSSFQLISVYIMSEAYLLPKWSNGTISSWWKPFFDILPKGEDLSAIPSKWALLKDRSVNYALLETLPTASIKHTERITALVKQDWEVVKPILQSWIELFPETTPPMAELFESYLDVYFLINSRCLYMEIPFKDDIKDFFTMVPFVDLLNHTNDVGLHCFPDVNIYQKGSYGLGQFSIRVGNHSYSRPKEEILLNYGAHSNDFLLAEYGFTTCCNRWNFIDITAEISEMISDPKDINFLEEIGYWGDYTISKNEFSFRVLVAVSLVCERDQAKTRKFALGYISEQYFEPKSSLLLNDLLLKLQSDYDAKIQHIRGIQGSEWCKRNLLTLYDGYIEIIDNNV